MYSMRYSRLFNALMLSVVVGLLFRNTLATVLGQLSSWLPIFGLCIAFTLYCVYILVTGYVRSSLLVGFYVSYLALLIMLFPWLSEYGYYPTAIIGFSNLAIMLCFWLMLFRQGYNSHLVSVCIRMFISVGLVNALFSIVQFYYSPDLFGLISNNIYANSDVVNSGNVTRRAVSFIASPQSLSLFLAFCFSLTFFPGYCSRYIVLIRALIFFSGVLTVSKAFFVFLFVFFVANYFSFRHMIKGFSLLSIFLLVVLYFQDRLGRVIQIYEFLLNPEKYSAFVLWRDSINYGMLFPEMLFGRGLGVFSRGSQMMFDYTILYGSTESFFIQLFVEAGLIGLLIFIFILFFSLIKLFARERVIFSCLCGFIVIGLFTPAIYGYATGICFYFCVVIGLVMNNKRRTMSYECIGSPRSAS